MDSTDIRFHLKGIVHRKLKFHPFETHFYLNVFLAAISNQHNLCGVSRTKRIIHQVDGYTSLDLLQRREWKNKQHKKILHPSVQKTVWVQTVMLTLCFYPKYPVSFLSQERRSRKRTQHSVNIGSCVAYPLISCALTWTRLVCRRIQWIF